MLIFRLFLFISSISSFVIQTNKTSQPTSNYTQCSFNLPYVERCAKWRVASIVLLEDDNENKMSEIQEFLDQVTKNCNSYSRYRGLGPTSGIPWLHKMESLMTMAPNPAKKPQTVDRILLKMEELVEDTRGRPLEQGEAGAMFLFTDLPCGWEDEELHWKRRQLTRELFEMGFLVRIMFLSKSSSDFECYQEKFRECSHSFPICVLKSYGEDGSDLLDDADKMQTCASNSQDTSTNLNTLQIVLLVTIPITIISLIACVCVYSFYRKTVRELIRQVIVKNLSTKEAHAETTKSPASHHYSVHTSGTFSTLQNHEEDPWQIDPANLEILEHELLGRGAFAKVVKGRLRGNIPLLTINATICLILENLKEGVCEVAVKKLPPHGDQHSVGEFLKEIEFMKILGYQSHIISMVGCVVSPVSPIILLEFCYHGDLLSFLRKNRPHVLMSDDEDCPIDADLCLRICDLISIAWQISDGMTYLHSKGWIHRDLAARNILLTKGMVAKISDFGLCRFADSALYVAKGGRLPVKYMSIEALKRFEFSTKSDTWAFGILLHELFSLGDTPYPTVEPMELLTYLEGGHRMEQPTICPNEIYALMMKCWEEESSERPTFDEIGASLRQMLNIEDEYYGYVTLENPKSVRYMLNREISQFPPSETKISTSISALNIFEDDEENGEDEFKENPSTSEFEDYYSTTSRMSTLKPRREGPTRTRGNSMVTITEERFPSTDTDEEMDTWSITTVTGTQPKLEFSQITSTCRLYTSYHDHLEYCSLDADMADFFR